MNDAELYAKHNSLQRQGVAAAILAYCARMRWAQDGRERVLDVGCGPGDVTSELLLPALPPESTVIGIDVSPKMLEYAISKNRMKNVHFKNVDFSMKDITSVLQAESFTKIFSFYCLQWIQDLRQIALNVRTLLRPSGEFLLVTASCSPVWKVYKTLAQSEQWKPYMHDVDRFIPGGWGEKYEEVGAEFQRTLESAGLEVAACDIPVYETTYPSKWAAIRAMEAINPFVNRMPAEERKHYWDCFEQTCFEQRYWRQLPSGEVAIVNNPVVAYGCRPPAHYLIDQA